MHKLNSLRIYTEALELAEELYIVTERFPEKEKFGITSQIRRAVSSIGANIAEGYGRKTVNDRKHFMVISKGSINETIYFMDLSIRLKYLEPLDYENLLNKIIKLDVKVHNFMNFL